MSSSKKEIVYYPFIGQQLEDEPFDLSKGKHSWTQQLKILADKNNIEIHTPDKATYKNVVGVIFFDNLFYHNLDDLMDIHDKGLLRKTIYIDYEPPTGHAKKHEPESIKELAKLFKYVITYDDDLAGTGNFIKGNVANFYAAMPKKKTSFDKRKMVCMITNATSNDLIIDILNSWNYTNHYNNKNIKYHPKAIYHKRQQIAEFFLANHPDNFDLYGAGWPSKFSEMHKGFVARDDKINKLSEYKFAITLDSYINQKGYISEKIFDAFFARTVPVYLGASNIGDYIPKECFIDIRDFNSFDGLYAYLIKMTKEEYNLRLSAIDEFLESDKFNTFFSSRAISKTLFSAIKKPIPSNYNDAEAQKVLLQLKKEKEAITTRRLGVIRVDKQHKDGKWCFVATLRNGTPDTLKITDTVVKKVGGKFMDVKTYITSTLDSDVNEVTMDIPYEDIIKNGQERYYVRMSDCKLARLAFFSTECINNTIIDNSCKFFVRGNTIKIKGRRRLKLITIRGELDQDVHESDLKYAFDKHGLN